MEFTMMSNDFGAAIGGSFFRKTCREGPLLESLRALSPSQLLISAFCVASSLRSPAACMFSTSTRADLNHYDGFITRPFGLLEAPRHCQGPATAGR